MAIYRFKTSLKCSGCVNNIGRYLNEIPGIGPWKVDINDPLKILEVESETDISLQIPEVLKKAGYQAERIQ